MIAFVAAVALQAALGFLGVVLLASLGLFGPAAALAVLTLVLSCAAVDFVRSS